MSNKFSVPFGTLIKIENVRLYINSCSCDFYIGGPNGDTDVSICTHEGDGYYIPIDELVWFDSDVSLNTGNIIGDGWQLNCRFTVEQPIDAEKYK